MTKPALRLLLYGSTLALGLAAAMLLMQWRVPTEVAIDVSVGRVEFVVDGGGETSVLRRAEVASLTVVTSVAVSCTPERIEAGSGVPPRDDAPEEPGSGTAWVPLAVTDVVRFIGQGKDLSPSVFLEGWGSSPAMAFVVDPVPARGGSRVVLEARQRGLRVRVDSLSPGTWLAVAPPPLFTLMHSHCEVGGLVPSPSFGNLRTLRLALPKHRPVLRVQEQRGSLTLDFRFGPDGAATPLSPDVPIPISSVRFEQQSVQTGQQMSSVRRGAVSSAAPEFSSVNLDSGDFVFLTPEPPFRVGPVSVDSSGSRLRLRLTGVARELRTGPHGNVVDRLPSQFDRLWLHERRAALVAVVGGVGAAFFAIWRVLRGG